MRSRIILLLAVFSQCVAPGPVRHQGRLAQHNKFPRFYNISSIPSTTDDLQTSTPVSLPSPSLSSSAGELSDTLTLSNTITSISAEGTASAASSTSESSTAASPSLPTAAVTQSSVPSTTSPTPTTLTTSSAYAILTSSDAESGAPIAFTAGDAVGSQSSTATQSAEPTQPPGSQGQGTTSSGPSAAQATPVSAQLSDTVASDSTISSKPALASEQNEIQLGKSNSAEFAPVTTASNLPTPTPSGLQYPTAENGNRAMADGFNQIYKSLNVASTCNANDNNQAVSCISGELAQCQADGTYVLKSCPDGQSCYALPKASGSTGVSVECAVPSDAAAQLSSASQTKSNVAAPSQVVSASQGSESQSSGNNSGSSTALPQTESIQVPVQQISSIAPTTASPSGTRSAQSAQPSEGATSTSQAVIAQSAGDEQRTSNNLPQTDSVQFPVQHVSSASQTTTSNSQAQASISYNSQTDTAQQSVQILSSFPPVQAAVHTQAGASASSTNTISTKPVQAESGSRPGDTSAASAAATGGRLFSIPNLQPSSSQASEVQRLQTTENSVPSPQQTSGPARSPSILAQEQPAPTATPAALPPHFPEPIPSAPTSGDNGGGITIVPLGAAPTHSAPVADQKLAVPNPDAVTNTSPSPTPSPSPSPNPNAYATPIYITVTVTTTAYDHSPSS